MRAGLLDRRITIQDKSITLNNSGEEIVEWQDIATVWAEKREIHGTERFAARQLVGHAVKTFRFRWSSVVSDLTTEHRLRFDGRDYDITDIREIGRRVGIEVDASASSELPLALPTITVPDGIVHYWPLDSLGDSTPDRVGGSAFDAIPVNAPISIVGQINNGVDLESVSSQFLISGTEDQGPQSGLTVCCWIKCESVGFGRLVAKLSVADPAAHYCEFKVNSNGSLSVEIWQSTSIYIGRGSSAGDLIAGTWTFVAMTWDGGTTTFSLKIYKNGTQIDVTNSSSGVFTAVYSGSDIKWCIGADLVNQASQTPSFPFDGVIDDVRIYDRELSQIELQEIYNAGLTGQP